MKPFFGVLAFLGLLWVTAVTINYRSLPTTNTPATQFDTIIVLGTPAQLDGTPSPEQRERVLEGVREYKAGVAHHLIMSGAAAHNQFTEAHTMTQLALTQGVSPADLVEEPQAMNTIQNIFYSAQIMHARGWRSAEVVSSPSHLPRTSLILTAFDREQPALAIDWRTHPAHWPPEYRFRLRKLSLYTAEAGYCLKLRLFGFPHSRFLPAG